MTGWDFGARTGEFRRKWVLSGNPDRLMESWVRKFFNGYLDLYPSDSQIYEMCLCAREEGSKDLYLTFGEACLLASEFKARSTDSSAGTHPLSSVPVSVSTKKRFNSMVEPPSLSSSTSSSSSSSSSTEGSSKKPSSYDVFLGGSCNPTTWRADRAIPFLKSKSLTFYNPQLPNWSPELIQLEHRAKQSSKLLFFVLSEKTRNVVSMIEVSYYAGAGRNLVSVLASSYSADVTFNGETPTRGELEDLEAGLKAVRDLIERESAVVFDDVDQGLTWASKLLKSSLSIPSKRNEGEEEVLERVTDGKLKIGDEILTAREAFDTLDTSRVGTISLDDMKMAFRVHARRDLNKEDVNQILSVVGEKGCVNFEEFCCILSEFKKIPNLDCEPRKDIPECGDLSSKTSHFCQNIVSPFSKFFHRFLSRSASLSSFPPPVKYRRRQGPNAYLRSRRGSSIRDAYLGGSVDDDNDWKNSFAIPLLKKNGLTFFTPSQLNSRKRFTPIEFSSIDNSRIIFFYIPGKPEYLPEMCEASYYIGQGCNVVLCIEAFKDYPDLKPGACKDYSRGRQYLSDIANREGVPVFEDLFEGLECLIQKCKNLKVHSNN